MENEYELERITYSKKRKLLLEVKDMLSGIAFPFMISLIFSSTIIAFSAYRGDLAVSLIALIGGEIMFVAAMIIFGRANGVVAYKKAVLYEKKRSLNSSDEKAVYGTGEYRLWKGFFIGFSITIPFIIVQIIQIAAPNAFCSFCLQYLFAWAYCPFSFLGEKYQALNFILVLLPTGVHALGYYLGKLKGIKVQEELTSQELESKKKRKKK